MKEKVLFSWSSGKDSGLVFHELKKDGCYEVVGLLTTMKDMAGSACPNRCLMYSNR